MRKLSLATITALAAIAMAEQSVTDQKQTFSRPWPVPKKPTKNQAKAQRRKGKKK